jgi:hypothetical protein
MLASKRQMRGYPRRNFVPAGPGATDTEVVLFFAGFFGGDETWSPFISSGIAMLPADGINRSLIAH